MKRVLLGFALGALLCATTYAPPVAADEIDVFPGSGSPCGADIGPIQCAIDSAADGDQILIHAGDYEENLVFSGFAGGDLRLLGVDGAAATIVRSRMAFGLPAGPVISMDLADSHVGHLVIEGLTLEQGDSGIRCNGNCPDEIRNVIIRGNRGYVGGGIHININQDAERNTPIRIFKAEITDNVAVEAGGGIAFTGYSDLEVGKSVVSNNRLEVDTGEVGVGGGLFAVVKGDHALEIKNNRFEDNFAFRGGAGMYVRGAGFLSTGPNGHLLMRRNLLQNNRAERYTGGGAHVAWLQAAEIEENDFFDNSIGLPTIPGSFADGGGLALNGGMNHVLLFGNRFRGNEAADRGGALLLETFHLNSEGALIEVYRNRLELNFAAAGAGAYLRATVDPSEGIYAADAVLINNIIAFNRTLGDSGRGGGLFLAAPVKLIHNTLYSNEAESGGAMAADGALDHLHLGFAVVMWNSVLWDNRASDGVSHSLVIAASDPLFAAYNDIEDAATASATILKHGGTVGATYSQDPLFVDADAGDFHLSSHSKLIGEGTPVTLNQYAEAAFDLEGRDRTSESGAHSREPLVDIGALEFNPGAL